MRNKKSRKQEGWTKDTLYSNIDNNFLPLYYYKHSERVRKAFSSASLSLDNVSFRIISPIYSCEKGQNCYFVYTRNFFLLNFTVLYTVFFIEGKKGDRQKRVNLFLCVSFKIVFFYWSTDWTLCKQLFCDCSFMSKK